MNPEQPSAEMVGGGELVWWLWRQDESGNQYRMPLTYPTEEACQLAAQEFANRGHHQAYEARCADPSDDIDFIPAKKL